MSHQPQAHGVEPIWRLCYRYLWPFQYFRDVTRGSRMECQQNYRYNRSMRAYLLGFAAKWSVLTLLWVAAGGFLDQAAQLVIPAACCFMTATWTLSVVVLLMVSWIWLERFPEL